MDPKVSVILPSYNHSEYIKTRIDSILAQTYKDFELIILDDCSPDKSRQIIEQYRENSKVSSIVYNEINSGSTFKQWQKGIELAKGDWIWIAESDDWCEPTFLETLIDGVTDECVMAFAQSLFVSENGKTIWNSRADYYSQVIEGKSFVEMHMLLNCGIANASMCIFRKKCYYGVDPEFTTFKLSGDWLFWVYIANQGKIFISGKILNYYLKHSNTVSGPGLKNGLLYKDYFRVLENFQKNSIIDETKKNALLNTKFTLLLKDDLIDPVVKRELYKEFSFKLGNKTIKAVLRYNILNSLKKIKKTLQAVWPM